MKGYLIGLMLSLLCFDGYAQSTITIEGPSIATGSNNVVIINGKLINDAGEDHFVRGSGKIESENRSVADFATLVVNIHANVSWHAGNKAELTIEADNNILPLIITESNNGTLIISVDKSYSTQSPIEIDIKTPALSVVAVNGSGTVNLDSVQEETMDLTVTGSGNISARGEVNTLSAVIVGSGNLNLEELQAKACAARINGSGTAELSVAHSLTAEINGSGNVIYYGSPDNVDADVRGSGEMIKRS